MICESHRILICDTVHLTHCPNKPHNIVRLKECSASKTKIINERDIARGTCRCHAPCALQLVCCTGVGALRTSICYVYCTLLISKTHKTHKTQTSFPFHLLSLSPSPYLMPYLLYFGVCNPLGQAKGFFFIVTDKCSRLWGEMRLSTNKEFETLKEY